MQKLAEKKTAYFNKQNNGFCLHMKWGNERQSGEHFFWGQFSEPTE